MRFLKVFLHVLLIFLAMMFFIQNTAVLSEPMTLQFNLFFRSWYSIPLPFYFLLLLAFFVGGAYTIIYFFMEKVRLSGQLRQYRSRMASLEQEVNSLRNLPLEDKGFPAPAPVSSASGDGIGE
ncbi:MAG: lipopolysaccharide assembly protein LapA domain-containing protein [Desulfovibrionaceae bacterium]